MSLVLKRTEQFLHILQGTIMQETVKLTNVEISESRDGSSGWKAFLEDSYWGKNDTWYRFRTRAVIPAEFAGKHVKCQLTTGREEKWNSLNPQFLLYVNGHAVQGLDTNHYTFELAWEAVAGEVYELEFEAYAGRELNNIRIQDAPLQFVLQMYCHEEASEKLYYDLLTAKMAAEMYEEKDYIRIRIENYLTKALNLLDCRVVNSEAYFASVRAAGAYMEEEFYNKFCGHEEVIADCVGHTHIDVAWLWRLEQTRAKAVRSFSTELALMEEYPEHFFSSSQPQLYQFVKEDCPEVYEQIRERVKEGRWEPEGAMWLEADCNISSGESLIRQILHGKRFMKQEFDVDSKVLWLPDVFGYSAALPQILKKTGVETFVTSKIHWNDTNHFPFDTFLWKGVDGSEIFAQFITASEPHAKLGDSNRFSTYNARIFPIAMAKGWEIYQQKDINNEILVSFGFGDGGGGVTREMLEMNRRMSKGIPGVPKTRITTITDTLARIKKNTEGKKLPKWFGELYLEYHRGTYTSIAKNKKYNRKSEFLLQSTEAATLTDKLLLGGGYDKQALYDGWTTILLNQFHDIIPGSSIREVYEDSEKQYQALIGENSVRLENALQDLAAQVCEEGIFVYNPTGTSQSGVVAWEGRKYSVRDVPAFGWKVVPVKQCEDPDVFKAGQPTGDLAYSEKSDMELQVSPTHMENRFFALDLDEKGTFVSIYDKLHDRQVLTEGQRGNVLLALDDHPYAHDNWEISNYADERKWEIDDVSSIEVVEENEEQASLKITRKFLSSVIEQTITIYKEIPRIDFDVAVDWHEQHIFVKTAFPVDIMSDKATYEIQYGAVERPAHMNTSWDAAKYEVCAQKWVDFGEADYGVALLNDCKYGHDIHDGVMRLSLFKCGTYPNEAADQGHHSFRYALMPHAGTWREAGVANEAYAFNCPLMVAAAPGTGNLPGQYSLAGADKKNIILTVAKEACDSEALILRAYESQGCRTKTTITCGFAVAAAQETDMLEQQVYEELQVKGQCFEASFRPYEIKTFRIERKDRQ